MSGGLLQYSGLVTKTRAMHGGLLKEEELVRLSEYESVEDFIAFLREADGYAAAYISHEEVAHRGQVETFIRNALYRDYVRLYRFAGAQARKGLEIIFFRYEVDVLKLCLEYAYRGGREYKLDYLNLFFDRHSCYDIAAVTQAKNVQELTAALAGTPYERLFAGFASEDDALHGGIAAQLDIYYYKTAWKRKDALTDARMRAVFTRILGTRIDWLNIMWMYRSKQFFEMKPSGIYANAIPVFYKLKKTEYQKLLDAATAEEFLEILGQTAYFTGKDALVKMGDEITSRMIMDKTYEKVCREYPSSIAPVLKYLYDKENEIDVLTTILEGIRYQVPPRDIRDLVFILQ